MAEWDTQVAVVPESFEVTSPPSATYTAQITALARARTGVPGQCPIAGLLRALTGHACTQCILPHGCPEKSCMRPVAAYQGQPLETTNRPVRDPAKPGCPCPYRSRYAHGCL